MGGAIHLFTLAGVPISASPWYFLLLVMLSPGSVLTPNGMLAFLITAFGVTVSLVAHEMGHALVARHLRQNPSIMLHGFGGLTSSERAGRDVEQASVIATGPALGLMFGLSLAGIWYGLLQAVNPMHAPFLFSWPLHALVRAILWPSIAWNVLNLVPLWPLDGGQLFRLGAIRVVGPRLADRATHLLALALLFAYVVWRGRDLDMYFMILPLMIAWQNVRALRGEISSGTVELPQRHTREMVARAREALDAGNYREAARLAHQARSQTKVPAPLLDQIWEIAGVAAAAQGELEEALSYLRRAPGTELVREATEHCLRELEREDELAQLQARWAEVPRGRHMGRFLGAVLAFLAIALVIVFQTPLARNFL